MDHGAGPQNPVPTVAGSGRSSCTAVMLVGGTTGEMLGRGILEPAVGSDTFGDA